MDPKFQQYSKELETFHNIFNMKKIILEGPSCTYKTTLASIVTSSYGVFSFSGEWHVSHKPYEPYTGPSLINIEPNYEEIIMESYYYIARLMQIFKFNSFVIDRFHISAQYFQKKMKRSSIDFNWLEEILLPLDARIILFTRTPNSYKEALEKRLFKSYHPELYSQNIEEFKKEQEVYRELVRKSILKNFEVDVTDGDLERVIQEIATWLKNE